MECWRLKTSRTSGVDEEDPERLIILLRDYEDDEDEEEIIDYGKMEVTGREIPFEEMLEK